MEPNLVENWLRRDPVRWISGGLAGLLAAVVAIGFAMILASTAGLETWFPLKLIGSIVLGPVATDINLAQGAVAGGILFVLTCIFLGSVFAHFVYTNALKGLLAMGLVWGLFSWIFIWNLYMQSFNTILAAQVSSAAAFPICVLFGLTLASVSGFDRMIRHQKLE